METKGCTNCALLNGERCLKTKQCLKIKQIESCPLSELNEDYEAYRAKLNEKDKQIKALKRAFDLAIDFVYPRHRSGACRHFYERGKFEESVIEQIKAEFGTEIDFVSF